MQKCIKIPLHTFENYGKPPQLVQLQDMAKVCVPEDPLT